MSGVKGINKGEKSPLFVHGGTGTRLHDIWLPVAERLPGHHDDVLASTEDGIVCRAFYGTNDGKWRCDFGILYDVTAWMPLPEPYREE